MDGWVAALIGAAALVVSGLGGWGVTAGVLHLAARSRDAGHAGPGAGGDDADPAGQGEPERTAGGEGDEGPGPAPDPERQPDGRPAGGTPQPSPDPDRSPPSDGPTGPRSQEVLRGGTWIGILERLAITGSLLATYPAAIAFVIAVKGLGRYPELRENPEASERFVIGTLASMLWAAAVGGAAQVLLP